MIRRVTITIDARLEAKIRSIQAKKISESKKSISFSTVVNEIIKKGIKNLD